MPDLKSQVIIPGPAADAALRHRAGARGRKRLPHLCLSDVAAGDVVQPAVVALAHERQDDIVGVADARDSVRPST